MTPAHVRPEVFARPSIGARKRIECGRRTVTAPAPSPRSRRSRLWLWLISLVGAAVLLWIASRRLELWPATLHIPRPELLLAAAALHVPYSLARSLRLRYALDPRVRAATGDPRARVPRDLLYGSGLVSFLVILLLPLRLGELSRPLILARAGVPGVGLPEAIAAVASERAVDGLLVVALLLLGISHAGHVLGSPAGVTHIGQGMGLVFLALVLGLATLALTPTLTLNRVAAALPGRLGSFLVHFAATLRDLAAPRRGLPLVGWSLVYWSLTVGQLWLVLHACGLALGLAEAAAVVGVVGLSIQLPGGPAQVGSYQVGSLTALALLVAPDDLRGPGSSFVAISYLLGLLGALVLALPGALLLARAARSDPTDRGPDARRPRSEA